MKKQGAKRVQRIREVFCSSCGASCFRRSQLKNTKCEACLKKAKLAWHHENKERGRLRAKDWYDRNKEKARESSRAWYAKNSAISLKRSKEWASKNMHRKLQMNSTRRANQIAATPKWSDKYDIESMHELCSIFRRIGLDLHVDHIVPLISDSVCGLHVVDNLQLLHSVENMRKSNRYWEDSF